MTEREWRNQALTLADELERLRLEVSRSRLDATLPQAQRCPAVPSSEPLETLHGELGTLWLALEERAPDLAPLLSRCIQHLEGYLSRR